MRKREKQLNRVLAMALAAILVMGTVRVPVSAAESAGDNSPAPEAASEVLLEHSSDSSELSEIPSELPQTLPEETADDEVVSGEEAAGQGLEDMSVYPTESVAAHTVTLDANGGFFVNEWDDALRQSQESAEIITKVLPAGTALTSFPKRGQFTLIDQEGQEQVFEEDPSITFAGWSLEPDGELISQGYEEYIPGEDCTLYAVWKPAEDNPSDYEGAEDGTVTDEGAELAEDGTVTDEGAELAEDGTVADEGTELLEDGTVADEGTELPEDGTVTDEGAELAEDNAVADEGSELPEDDTAMSDEIAENTEDDTVMSDETAENTEDATAVSDEIPESMDDGQTGEVAVPESGEEGTDEGAGPETEDREKSDGDVTAESTEQNLPQDQDVEAVSEEAQMAVIASGSCGEHLTWSLNSSGVLTISGTGKMYDYYGSTNENYIDGNSPWYRNRDSITGVNLPAGITRIGNYAFFGCGNLRKIDLPDSVTSLGYRMIEDTSITSIQIPVNVTECSVENRYPGIKGGPLCGSKVTKITFADGMKKIPSNICEAEDYVEQFDNDPVPVIIDEVIIPDSVTTIGSSAFACCGSLMEIEIPSSVTTIEGGAFYNCSSLAKIQLKFDSEESKASYPGLDIGGSVFTKCIYLFDTNLDEYAVSVGNYAFSKCDSLGALDLKKVKSIGDYAFNLCGNLAKVNMNHVETIGSNIFQYTRSISEIRFTGSAPSISGDAFKDAVITAYYPPSDSTWTQAVKQNYGGTVTWKEAEAPGTISLEPEYECFVNKTITISAIYKGNSVINSAVVTEAAGNLLVVSTPTVQALADIGNQKQAKITFTVNAKKTGKYALKLTANDGAEAGTTINCKTFFEAALNERDKNCTYTGKAIEPKPVVTGNDGLVLTEGTDYSLSYKDNIEPGTATVIVTGKGVYSGQSVSVTFEIHDDIKINLDKEIKGSPGTQVLISADIESKRISPDSSNVEWEITPSDGQEGPVTWGSMSVITSGQGKYIVCRPVTLSDRGNYLLTLSFGGVSASALISMDVKYYLVFTRVKTMVLGEKGLVTAQVRAYDPADDPNEESAKITWAVEDSSYADVTYDHLYAGQIVNITGKKPGKTRLVATFSDGSTQSREITIEPSMTVTVGAKLKDGSIDEVKRITGYSNVWCTVSLEGFGADRQYLNKFINEVTYNREALEKQVDIIKEERKVSEDGLKAWINLRVGYKDPVETVRAAFDFASSEENHARKAIEVSKDLKTTLAYRANGALWKYEDGDNERYLDGNHAFLFSNDYYYEDARNYSNDLAVMSLGLEMASWTSHDFDDRYTKTVAREKNLNIAFSKLGFRDPVFHKYDTALNNFADLAAFGIAAKTITNRDRDDTLIAVAIRGGGYGAEWASNFHLGDNGDALGFRSAANLAAVELKQYIDDLVENGKYTGRIKIWIVGFSRGGATANLLGHYVNEGVLEIDLERKDTFVYTFATPSGQRGENHSEENIHNIVSSSDLVPRIVLNKGWGFSKYGNTKTITACYTTKAVEDSFRNFTGESLNVGDASENISTITDWMYEMIPNTNDYTNLVQESMITAYKNSYAEKESASNIVSSPIIGLLSSPAMVGKFLAGPDFANAWDRGDYDSAIEIGFKRSASTYKLLKGDVGIVDALKFVLKNKGLLALVHSHFPEHYLAWLESGGIRTMEADTYASLDQSERAEIEAAVRNEFQKAVAKRYDIHCPVDVTVYSSSGSIVGKIENDQVTVDEIPCFADGDKKVVYIPTGDSYHIEMTGTDYGKMDYSVSEYSEEYDLLRTVEFYEVDLSPGIVYEGDVTDQVLDPDETYSLTAGNITTVPSIDTARGILEPFTLTVISGETKEYQILKGDQVTILPSVPENDTFIKWITDDPDSVIDDCLKEEATVTMPSHDITVRAHLASQHEWSDQYTVDIEPTDEEAGVKSIHCRFCDAVQEGSQVEIPSTDSVPLESGTAGSNISWTLYKSGKLVIEGTGQMPDWSISGAPWKAYASQIKKAVIQEGFTNVGKGAFETCGNMTEAVIPAGVKSIGEYAFNECGSLSKMVIPEGVTSIGYYAFSGCGSMTELIIPDSVSVINMAAFKNCSSLEEATLPAQLAGIDKYTFLNCSGLKKIVIPENVTSISDSAFRGCTGLTEVIIPAGVTYLGQYAFYGCSGLLNVAIPEGISKVDIFAFKGCSSLESVVIPEGVTRIDGGAFENCTALSSVAIPETVTEIGSYAFSGCADLEKVYYFGTAEQWNSITVNDDKIKRVEIIYVENSKNLAYSGITGLTDIRYTGAEITQTPTVSLFGDILTEGRDYTLSFSNNVETGSATVTVNGKGSYSGSASASFRILPIPFSTAVISGLSDKTYTGGAIVQAPRVTIGSDVLTADTDYTLQYEDNRNVGTATVTVTGIGHYEGSVSGTFRINPADISEASVTDLNAGTYSGEEQTSKPTVTFGSVRLAEGTDYSLSYENNIHAGTAEVKINGKGNYEGSLDASFEILPASISSASVSGITAKTYTGKEIIQNPTISAGNEVLKWNEDFDIVYRNNIRAGIAGLMICGIGDYSGEISDTFTINPADLGDAVIGGLSEKVFTGEALTQDLTVTIGDTAMKAGRDFTAAYSDNTNAGTATVTITGKGNYTGRKTATFRIRPVSISDAEISGIVDKIYTGSAVTQDLTVKAGASSLKQGTDYSIRYENNTNAGTADVTITGNGNYEGTRTISFRIKPASISAAAISGIKDKTYTGKALTQSPTVKLESTTLKSGTDYSVSYKNNTSAGTATITFTGKGNYSGTKTAAFKINKAAQSITAKLSASVIATGKTATVSVTGQKEKASVTYKSSNTAVAAVNASMGKITAKKVGTAKITAAAAETANYNAASKTITIKVVPAATSSITASNEATGMKLTWKKVTGANGYLVYRGSTKIAALKGNSIVTYTDKKANTNGTRYIFKIVPTSSTGNGTAKSLTTYRISRPSISSATNSAVGKVTVKWAKNAKGTGYQIQYSTDKTFTSGSKSMSVKGASSISKVIGSMSKGKTYYFRIRTYKTVGSRNYYSAWSTAKSVRISK